MSKDLLLFSDYNQIHILDRNSTVDPPDAWWRAHPASDYLAPEDDAVAIGTGVNGYVTVTVEVTDGPPTVDQDAAEVVAECSLRADSGQLIMTDPVSGREDAPLVSVPRGWLRLRTSLAWWPDPWKEPRTEVVDADNLDESSIPPYLRDEPTVKVLQRVRIHLWPAAPADPVLIKG